MELVVGGERLPKGFDIVLDSAAGGRGPWNATIKYAREIIGPARLGVFSLSGGDLRFDWAQPVGRPDLAPQLSNCVLKVTIEDAESEPSKKSSCGVRLRRPATDASPINFATLFSSREGMTAFSRRIDAPPTNEGTGLAVEFFGNERIIGEIRADDAKRGTFLVGKRLQITANASIGSDGTLRVQLGYDGALVDWRLPETSPLGAATKNPKKPLRVRPDDVKEFLEFLKGRLTKGIAEDEKKLRDEKTKKETTDVRKQEIQRELDELSKEPGQRNREKADADLITSLFKRIEESGLCGYRAYFTVRDSDGTEYQVDLVRTIQAGNGDPTGTNPSGERHQ